MKMNSANRLLFSISLGVSVLVTWGVFHRPQPHSLFDALNGDAKWFLEWPLFGFGNLTVTPLFLVKCTIFVILLTMVSRMSGKFLGKEILGQTSMDRGQQYAIVRGFVYLVFLLGLIIGLDSTGLNLRSLLVVGGALGVGVGFGLQNIVANFVAGLVILWERPVKVGDLIEAGNTHGEVIRIGARGTWVRTFDNEVIIVPNSEFVNNRVTNWTANDRTVRLSVPVGVSYDCDIDTVRELLLAIARHNSDVLATPAPSAIVSSFGDNAVNIVLRASTGVAERAVMVKSDLLMEIFRVFREHKIEMPFPQRDLHIRSVDAPFVISVPAVQAAAQGVIADPPPR
ncbi:MAG: mechanosensitive ion channel domain-containing protein [Candidatus Acidiferrales bacterium]|jgi:small-conductance mechanosensitive channel